MKKLKNITLNLDMSFAEAIQRLLKVKPKRTLKRKTVKGSLKKKHKISKKRSK